MKKALPSNKIYLSVSQIANAGRGIYANIAIKKGEVIEVCPVISVSKNDTAKLSESVLNTYFFYYGKNKDKLFVALGFGSLYNHTLKPNATYKIKSKHKTIEFSALRGIKKDEEITVNYSNGNAQDKIPLWIELGNF